MPLLYNEPVQTIQTKNSLKILSFTIDLANSILSVIYVEGATEGDVFTPVGDHKQANYSGAAFNTLVMKYPTLYGTMKQSLYTELMSKINKQGTLS